MVYKSPSRGIVSFFFTMLVLSSRKPSLLENWERGVRVEQLLFSLLYLRIM